MDLISHKINGQTDRASGSNELIHLRNQEAQCKKFPSQLLNMEEREQEFNPEKSRNPTVIPVLGNKEVNEDKAQLRKEESTLFEHGVTNKQILNTFLVDYIIPFIVFTMLNVIVFSVFKANNIHCGGIKNFEENCPSGYYALIVFVFILRVFFGHASFNYMILRKTGTQKERTVITIVAIISGLIGIILFGINLIPTQMSVFGRYIDIMAVMIFIQMHFGMIYLKNKKEMKEASEAFIRFTITNGIALSFCALFVFAQEFLKLIFPTTYNTAILYLLQPIVTVLYSIMQCLLDKPNKYVEDEDLRLTLRATEIYGQGMNLSFWLVLDPTDFSFWYNFLMYSILKINNTTSLISVALSKRFANADISKKYSVMRN